MLKTASPETIVGWAPRAAPRESRPPDGLNFGALNQICTCEAPSKSITPYHQYYHCNHHQPNSS